MIFNDQNTNMGGGKPSIDFTDCTTQRQRDTKIVRTAITDFADSYPAAGEILSKLGGKALNVLTDRILQALHPRVQPHENVYTDIARSFYDMPFGSSL